MAAAREAVENLLRAADVRTDGARPWDIEGHDQRIFYLVARWRDPRSGRRPTWMALGIAPRSPLPRALLDERFAFRPGSLFSPAASFAINRQTRRRTGQVGRVLRIDGREIARN